MRQIFGNWKFLLLFEDSKLLEAVTSNREGGVCAVFQSLSSHTMKMLFVGDFF